MRREPIGRRDFVAGICVAAAAWPFSARAQQPDRMRRVGVIMNLNAEDPEAPIRVGALRSGLQQLGWTEGHNLRFDFRWSGGDLSLYRQYAAELVAIAPDVIVATAGPIVAALQRETRTLPIVFTTTIDPLRLGYVESLARPGGNATGIGYVAHGLSGKYLQLLKEITPQVTRVGVLYDPTVSAGIAQFEAVKAEAPLIGFAVTPVGVRDAVEMEFCSCGIGKRGERWPDRDCGCVRDRSSRRDRRTCGSVPPARGLSQPLLCRQRRSAFVRAGF